MSAPAPKPWIMGIAPYVPGRATSEDGRKVAKLSSNENPFGTPDAARAAYRDAAMHLERYPDAAAVDLRSGLAAHYGVEADRLIYGTGSDEVLHLAAGTFAGPGDEIIHVRYGFAVYEIATRRVGATPVVVADRDYATDVDAILAAVTERTKVVFVANPNNPTGTYSTREEIARLHAGLPSSVLLVLDQAYTEYLEPEDDDGGLELARTASNVLVARTFSRSSGWRRSGWAGATPRPASSMRCTVSARRSRSASAHRLPRSPRWAMPASWNAAAVTTVNGGRGSAGRSMRCPVCARCRARPISSSSCSKGRLRQRSHTRR